MSYQVLARKYRPASFHEMVGQTHVLQALINALDSQRLHHAYLFTGTRGVGKTSIARILAKCLNCEEGISSSPCGRCNACQEISQGRFVDLIEVDAASRTRVEDTRELLDNVQYAPTKGRFKIYLIDEVHMLSTHSFNALLKTLEEPPSHVKFLLATTDPQKLPVTILSRCLQFNLKNLTTQFIAEHLKTLLTKESFETQNEALWAIADAAKGSMRDALSLTDQAIAFCSGQIQYDAVSQMLGSIDQQKIHQLLTQLVEHNASGIMDTIQQISEFSPDYTAILDAVLYGIHQLTLAQVVPKSLSQNPIEKSFLTELASKISAEELQLFYQMGLLGKKDLPYAPEPKSGLEMALLRMLTFRPRSTKEPRFAPSDLPPSSTVKENLNGAENKAESTSAETHSINPISSAAEPLSESLQENASTIKKSTGAFAPKPIEANLQATPPEKRSSIKTQDSTEPAASLPGSHFHALSDSSNQAPTYPESELSTQSTEITPRIEPIVEAATSTKWLFKDNNDWLSQFTRITFTGLAKAIVRQMALAKVENDKLIFVIRANQANLFNDKHPAQIEAALTEYFQQPVEVIINIEPHDWLTPEEHLAKLHEENLLKAKSSIYADKQIQSIVDRFGAKIDDNSIHYL